MTPCIWLGTTHPCNPPSYGLWVNLLFFMMCIYKHCFPPMLLVFAMKCTKMLCPLPYNHYNIAAYFLHLYACFTCSSVHASSFHPLLAHHHLCYVDVYCDFFIYFGYMLLFFVTPFWIVCVHILVWLFFLYHFILAVYFFDYDTVLLCGFWPFVWWVVSCHLILND